MKKKITRNLGLKILAVLFSIILWLIVVNINDPLMSVSFYGIPVEIKNTDAITKQGKMYEVLDGTDVIDVVIRANRSIVDSISKDNIKAVADMEQLTFMDTVGIQLSTNKYNEKLDSITSSTDSLRVSIEAMAKSQLVVNCETTGEPASGYMLGTITTDQNIVRLTGPESAISRVSKAVANVNIEGMTSDMNTSVELKLYDDAGIQIESNSIMQNIASINASVEILEKASVPLSFKTVGDTANGYIETGKIVSSPDKVLIAGRRSVIEGISTIEIADLNVTEQSSDMTTSVKIKDYLPDGVKYIGTTTDSTITIVVGIEKIETQAYHVPVKNLMVINVPEDLDSTILDADDFIDIQLTGLLSVLQSLKAETIAGTVDLSVLQPLDEQETLKPGKYSCEVAFAPVDGVEVSLPVNVQIELKEKDKVDKIEKTDIAN